MSEYVSYFVQATKPDNWIAHTNPGREMPERSVTLTFAQIREGVLAACQQNDDPELAEHFLDLVTGGVDESKHALTYTEAMDVLLEPISGVDVFRLKEAGGSVAELVEVFETLEEHKVHPIEERAKALTHYIDMRCQLSMKHNDAVDAMINEVREGKGNN